MPSSPPYPNHPDPTPDVIPNLIPVKINLKTSVLTLKQSYKVAGPSKMACFASRMRIFGIHYVITPPVCCTAP